ncbi:hypothetical protein RNZ50_00425 [Paracoccaceae bacterium Fryx2]|nr:hypothetical protein [Paracoccaceae bacterium Fryx2]
MTFIASLGGIAFLLATAVPPAPVPPGSPGPEHLVQAGTKGPVVADFGVVEYYPNLKSKIGFATNIRRTELADAGPYIDDLGPGLMCSNIEFDHWYKDPGTPVPALAEDFEIAGDASSRPTYLHDTPGAWLTGYQRMVGDLDVAQLYQLTGAPAQYQAPSDGFFEPGKKRSDAHPAPVDPEAAARLMAAWTAEAKHPYPVLWSLWNEPSHTLLGALERRASNDKGKKNAKARKADNAALLDGSSMGIVELFALYSAAMRPVMDPHSRFGLASFLASNLTPVQMTSNRKVYLDEVIDALRATAPGAPVDFLSFNSFSDRWAIILSGVRNVLGTSTDFGPVIFTQYAPRTPLTGQNLNDGARTREEDLDSTPLQVAVDMIGDVAQFNRATDVQHVCMSYWVGGEYGFLQSRNGKLRPTVRYHAIRMLADLPVVRTRLDFAGTGLTAQGVRGLAGLNQAKAAVLLWNEGDAAVSVPLALAGLPAALLDGGAQATVTTLDGAGEPDRTGFDGRQVALPAHGMVLLEIEAAQIPDPLARRHPLGAPDGDGGTRFLQTRSFTDRVADSCTGKLALPGISGCARNSGTYGFYDSVRGVAYLGQGTGQTDARVTATYQGLPDRLFVNARTFAAGTDVPGAAVGISATFAACGIGVEAPAEGLTPRMLDFRTVPADCREGAATMTISLSGVPAGTQAEVFLSADAAEADMLARFSPAATLRADPPDLEEGLVIPRNRSAP